MTAFRFTAVTPHAVLSPYIAKMYVFESGGRLPEQDVKLIVPNANLKLTLTYRNGIAARVGGKNFVQPENGLSLTGLIDTPVMLDPSEDRQTGTIIIEINPLGAYRLFRCWYGDIKNEIVELEDLMGKVAARLQMKLADAGDTDTKLRILQQFLIDQLQVGSRDEIYDYCIERIAGSRGVVSVARLEKETGYSSRWLHKKFLEHLGTGPKNLCEIIRFKQFYQAYSTGASMQSLKQTIYENYHDQSHFIRAFKRFTGFTPTTLHNHVNELASRHYRS